MSLKQGDIVYVLIEYNSETLKVSVRGVYSDESLIPPKDVSPSITRNVVSCFFDMTMKPSHPGFAGLEPIL